MRISIKEVEKNQKPKEEEWIFGYYVTRRVSKYITFIILNLSPRINPNFLTVFGGIWGILGTILLSFPDNLYWLIGSFLCFSFFIWDCVDGEVARIQKKTSEYGKYLDKFFHPLFNILFLGFGSLGLYFITHFILILYLAFFTGAFLALREVLEALSFTKEKEDFDWQKDTLIKKMLKAFLSFQGFGLILFIVSFIDFLLGAFYLKLIFILGGEVFLISDTLIKARKGLKHSTQKHS